MAVKNPIKYRLGLDMGTNSLGWAMIGLDDKDKPCSVFKMGVRVFPDGRVPRSESSNAKTRWEARGARRMRDRYLKRRQALMSLMIQYGLMPNNESQRKELEKLDPYELRKKALDMELPVHHVGRAIFHLNQRRGFQSNRKAEKGDKNTGPVKEAIKKLADRMAKVNARTLGEFLYKQQGEHKSPNPIRFRNLGTENKAVYEFYPTRQMLKNEFEKIWNAQAPCHIDSMTDEAKKALHDTIFTQNPLKPQTVGKCTLDPAKDKVDKDGFRCPWAHPLAQRFRIYQDVRNLEVRNLRDHEGGWSSRRLSKEEGDLVAKALIQQKTVNFDRIRKLLKFPSDAYFNLESDRRKELSGDQTAANLSGEGFFGKAWRKLPLHKQVEIVDQLLDEEYDEKTTAKCLENNADLDSKTAEAVVAAFLPEGHCRLGLRAMRKILPLMEEEGLDLCDAEKMAGYHTPPASSGKKSPTGRLPYYGEWLQEHLNGTGDPRDPVEKCYGRYPNPTVHIGLGQLRRVVNALIKEYGPPHQVVVEMTRDLKRSKKQRDALNKEQTANQKKNDARNEKLKEIGPKQNYENRLKMRLWEELNPENACDRCCPYTGDVISLTRLFSDEVEFEHLIPWKDSWDDSPANKTVSMRWANRDKGNRTPFEQWGNTPEWDGIHQRAQKLPLNKRWRFDPDAREHFEKQGGFLARQLKETGWLARMSKKYLEAVVDPNNIWVTPGRLTFMIRDKWGLNSLLPGQGSDDVKKRTDHRHHAIDASVVAFTERSLLMEMSKAYDEARSRIKVPLPWVGLPDQVKDLIGCLVVSHKPDHGTPNVKGTTTGQLHDATAYGFVPPAMPLKDGSYKVVIRKKLTDFKKRAEIHLVQGEELKAALFDLWDRVGEGNAPEFARQAAQGVKWGGGERPVKRVRLTSNKHIIPVEGPDGVPYKGYLPDAKEFADVWEMPDKRKNWKVEIVPTFDVNQSNFDVEECKPHPDAKHLMRLYKGDMGMLGEEPDRRIVRVRKFEGKTVVLDDHNEGNVDKRERDKLIKRNRGHGAKKLQKENFRKIRVDEVGRIWDPGPCKR